MKKTSKYLDIATKLLLEIYKDDSHKTATIIWAQVDKDYETIYAHLKTIKDEIGVIEDKLKQEGGI